jgi:phenylalanyl-tRNA synthetase beta chain
MKFTVSWLKEHLKTDASLLEITEGMTRIGLEVEEVINPQEVYAPFKVAYVREARPHPDADKLLVCTVQTDEGDVEVVCGAPNAKTGMYGIFAPTGTQPPNVDFVLKKAKIRGVESNGMLCSEREMGLSDEHDGIIELEGRPEVGTPFAVVMGLNDPVIDFEVTPNRADWNGVTGVARDLAASGLGELISPEPEPVLGGFDSPIDIDLRFPEEGTSDACSRFAGRTIRGVKNGPSPLWLQQRLKAVGLRPINALVDMTNYISLDRARPLHVYDADKLKGVIHARLGKENEKFLALDGEDYEVGLEACVIADDTGVLGLGGIMGGEATGCTQETVNVFIEAAYFDPIRTARTGRSTGIQSDARYRFERGVDPRFVVPGLEMATQMVLDLCGGEPSHIVDRGRDVWDDKTVSFRPSRVLSLTGMDLPEDDMARILKDLGFSTDQAEPTWQVSVPSWRPDIEGEADIVEEVSHIFGFDHLPATPLPRLNPVAKPVLTLKQSQVRWARRAAACRGLFEAVTYSFTHQPWAETFGGGGETLKLANPISSELAAMRPSILPNLLAAVQRNVDRGAREVLLFEVGPQYSGAEPEDQSTVVAGVRRGGATRSWTGNLPLPQVFDAKADALAVLSEVGAPTNKLMVMNDAPDYYHPGRSGTLCLGPKVKLARFGELHPGVLKLMGVKGPIVAFEVFLDALPAPRKKGTKGRAVYNVSDFQSVERDFAFIVGASVAAETMLRAAQGADKKLIEEVGVFDVFEGASIGEGKKSVAISITLQPTDRTLTDDEIEAVGAKVVAAVTKATGGELRS